MKKLKLLSIPFIFITLSIYSTDTSTKKNVYKIRSLGLDFNPKTGELYNRMPLNSANDYFYEIRNLDHHDLYGKDLYPFAYRDIEQMKQIGPNHTNYSSIKVPIAEDGKKFSTMLKKKLQDLENKKTSSKEFMELVNTKINNKISLMKSSIPYGIALKAYGHKFDTLCTKTMILALKKNFITEQDFKKFVICDVNNKALPIFSTEKNITGIRSLLNLFLKKALSKKTIEEILNTKAHGITPIADAARSLFIFPENSSAILAYLLPRLFNIAIDMEGVDLKKLPENEICPWIKQLAKSIASEPDNKELVQKIHNDIKTMIIKADKKSEYMPHIKKLIENSWE